MYTTRVMGVDPGGNTGIGIIDLSNKEDMHLVFATTLNAEYLSRSYKYFSELHGEKLGKQHALYQSIRGTMFTFEPDYVICEKAFYNPHRPMAYASLIENISIGRRALNDYRHDLPLEGIDAALVKKNLQVSGNSSDKDLVRNRVKKINLHVDNQDYFETLDEHAIDAIAIAYGGILKIKNT